MIDMTRLSSIFVETYADIIANNMLKWDMNINLKEGHEEVLVV